MCEITTIAGERVNLVPVGDAKTKYFIEEILKSRPESSVGDAWQELRRFFYVLDSEKSLESALKEIVRDREAGGFHMVYDKEGGRGEGTVKTRAYEKRVFCESDDDMRYWAVMRIEYEFGRTELVVQK